MQQIKVPTVWHKWLENARNTPDKEAIIHWLAGEEPVRWTFGALIERAQHYGHLLHSKGVHRNQVCAIIIRHNPEFYPIYMGVCSLGAIPAVLAYPNPRLHPEKFRQGLEGMSQRSGLDWILTEKELAGVIEPFVRSDKSTVNDLIFPIEESQAFKAEGQFTQQFYSGSLEDPFLLQHSSGTTGLQKPVLLTNRSVLSHVENYASAIALNERDKIVSWLPLYHDMGLIAAFHLPLAYGITSIQIDPFEWVLVPQLLIEAASREKATLCWLPNFAYNFMADKIEDEELEGLNLRKMRMFINCSEPVREESHRKFCEKFEKIGVKHETLTTCYAMAETTYAITQTLPGEQVRVIFVDKDEYAQGRVVLDNKNDNNSKKCVSSGRPISGCAIKIVGPDRNQLQPNCIGELAVSSVSMFEGYRNYPEKTAESLVDGWFYTGDYGFEFEGEYFVIGRKKDIIISAGKNIYPEDIEDAINNVPHVMPGRVIAFGDYDEKLGTELLCVACETEIEKAEDKKQLKTAILKAAMQIDMNIAKVFLLPPRWLIKSSSGKPSRRANKERLLNEIENKNKWEAL